MVVFNVVVTRRGYSLHPVELHNQPRRAGFISASLQAATDTGHREKV
jgi:hypothetical protein